MRNVFSLCTDTYFSDEPHGQESGSKVYKSPYLDLIEDTGDDEGVDNDLQGISTDVVGMYVKVP